MAVVNLAMYIPLWVLYRNQDSSELSFAGRTPSRAAVVTVVLIIGAVAVTGVAASQQAVFQHTVTNEVDSVLDDPAYSGVDSVAVQTNYAGFGAGLVSSPKSTTVTVSASNESYPNLSTQLRNRIQSKTGGTNVTVQFNTFQQANQTTGT